MFCCNRLQHCLHSTTRGHCIVTKLMVIYQILWSPLISNQSCLELSLYKLSQTDWTCIIKTFRTYCSGLRQNCRINHPAQPAFRLFSFCSMNTRPLGCFQLFLRPKYREAPGLCWRTWLSLSGYYHQKCVFVCVTLGREWEYDVLRLL